MRDGPIFCAVLAAYSLGILRSPGRAQTGRQLGVWVESHGSVPPIPDWFGCVREPDKKPYDKIRTQTCLHSILSHQEVLKGKVSPHHYKAQDALTFRVESPSLTVTDVDLGIAPADLAQVHELLAINGGALHPGAIYEDGGEASSRLVLDLFFRSQGRRARISRTVHLDYKQKTAQVALKIWEGPPRYPQPLLPPYAEPCKITNGYFNWMDIDDLSPKDFIERQMKTKWLGCFSEADLQDDLVALKKMKFLAAANIIVEGTRDMKSISVHLRGRPIRIANIKVKGYGLLDGVPEGDVPPISIHAGDTYSRSDARSVETFLKRTFEKSDRQVEVFTDVEVNAVGEADLEFSVLAYPDDLVYVNGAKFDGSFHNEN